MVSHISSRASSKSTSFIGLPVLKLTIFSWSRSGRINFFHSTLPALRIAALSWTWGIPQSLRFGISPPALLKETRRNSDAFSQAWASSRAAWSPVFSLNISRTMFCDVALDLRVVRPRTWVFFNWPITLSIRA